MKNYVFVMTTCFILFSAAVFAEDAAPQPKPPFLGQLNTDNVNIRAGANQNFEILAKANSDDLVLVIDEGYGWYKVSLPKTAACYVYKDFIEKNDTVGISKVSNLNLRARPNQHSSIIGQLAKGDAVTLLDETADGWYQIEPPPASYGYVRSDLVGKETTESKKSEKQKRGFLWW